MAKSASEPKLESGLNLKHNGLTAAAILKGFPSVIRLLFGHKLVLLKKN